MTSESMRFFAQPREIRPTVVDMNFKGKRPESRIQKQEMKMRETRFCLIWFLVSGFRILS
jgi:hypothetical protein